MSCTIYKVKNPMDIILIIRKIFEFLEPEDLFKCRFINSLWKEEADERIRISNNYNSKVLKFHTPLKISQYITIFKEDFLHDSFKFDLKESILFNFIYRKMVGNIGQTARHLDLTHHFLGKDGRLLLKENEGKEKKMAKGYVKMFNDFPNLSFLEMSDFGFDGNNLENLSHWIECFKTVQMPSLRIFSYHVESQDAKLTEFLSARVMRISPNLREIKLRIFGKLTSKRIFKTTLKAISEFAPQVGKLTFIGDLVGVFEAEEEIHSRENFVKLNIKCLTFDFPFLMKMRDHEQLFKFFYEMTPLRKTVEEFHLVSLYGGISNLGNILRVEVISAYIPIQFLNVKILEFQLPNPDVLHNQQIRRVLNKLATELKLVEKFTTSLIPFRPEKSITLRPWNNLRKLYLKQNALYYSQIGQSLFYSLKTTNGFKRCLQFIQEIGPNLKELEIGLLTLSTPHNRIGQILAYPILIWMSGKLENVEKFKITLNDRLLWKGGMKEMHLGINSILDLCDEEGEFTTKEIQKFNFSLFIREEDFLTKVKIYEEESQDEESIKEELPEEFLKWLLLTFPKHEILQKEHQRYLDSINADRFTNFQPENFLSQIYHLLKSDENNYFSFEREKRGFFSWSLNKRNQPDSPINAGEMEPYLENLVMILQAQIQD